MKREKKKEKKEKKKRRERKRPVAILAQAISCLNVRGVFPVHERFWFCLVQQPGLSFLILSHGTCERRNRRARISGTSLLFEYGFDGSVPDLDGTGFRATTMEEKNQ